MLPELRESVTAEDLVAPRGYDLTLAGATAQNAARVHFDGAAREDGRRRVYGGHVISLARALSYNGREGAAQPVVALNAGSHVAPCFAGDAAMAWSKVLDKVEVAVPGAGALRLRLVAAKAGTEVGPVAGGMAVRARGFSSASIFGRFVRPMLAPERHGGAHA